MRPPPLHTGGHTRPAHASSPGERAANDPAAPRLPVWPQTLAHCEIGRDVRPFALTLHASPVRRAAAHGSRWRASHAAPGPERRFLPPVAGRAVHTRPHRRRGSRPSPLCALPSRSGPRRRLAATGKEFLSPAIDGAFVSSAMHPGIAPLTPGSRLAIEIIQVGKRDAWPEVILDHSD